MVDLAKIHCPICNKPHTWQSTNPFKPFCSERCKLIDLGEWAGENRSIQGQDTVPLDDNEDSSERKDS